MVLGTGSHVGKSLIVAALCRIFAQRGVSVAPFKSQNMSLNSAATPEGLEIGRAQALQAEAAGIPPSVHMNPILLKPSGDMTSQVIVHGKVYGQFSADDYHRRRVEDLMPFVVESYEYLASRYQLLILEGAGSPAEINLKEHDIVNMRMAEMANAACLLVGDIDRGGVFASLYGTLALLDPPEQARIRGFIVNKFRGDLDLLTPGLRMMEDRIHKPCLGTIPHLPGLSLDEEDSVSLPRQSPRAGCWPIPRSSDTDRQLNIAVAWLPSLANFTDFDGLAAEPSVSLRYVSGADGLASADLIILPGSKQTAQDLAFLQTRLATTLKLLAQRGTPIVGICGGMQMLGRTLSDPHSMESGGTVEGLGLLPIHTTLRPEKTTVLAQGRLSPTTLFNHPTPPTPVAGYEIHLGQTTYLPGAQPFAQLTSGSEEYTDGCISADSRIFGTYLHGLFDDDAFRHLFLSNARAFHNLNPPQRLNNYKQHREQSLNTWAAHVERSLDMPEIFRWAGQSYRP